MIPPPQLRLFLGEKTKALLFRTNKSALQFNFCSHWSSAENLQKTNKESKIVD